ncbi:MAG: PmoA family protein [Planctomycetaceae bacterium]|nr:PmoA family protein [Planctomycetaceae bacterium]
MTDSSGIPLCRCVPLPNGQVSFQVGTVERLRWYGGTSGESSAPRPFFYPLNGPSGQPLTRMGHPGAPNHDHHRSIWFAHHAVSGVNFWSDQTTARIRQRHWLAYEDSSTEARMAVSLDWLDGHDPAPLLEQELICTVRPVDWEQHVAETLVEIQTTLRPRAESLELGQTNFGLLAVRVAAYLSEYFGGGLLTNSEGRTTEKNIFAHAASWMDYSGPVPGDAEEPQVEGITFFDHPGNPGYPSRWHVREDGWMGASLNMNGPLLLQRSSPLTLRYLLHAHTGPLAKQRASTLAEQFSHSSGLEVKRSTVKHRTNRIERKSPPE